MNQSPRKFKAIATEDVVLTAFELSEILSCLVRGGQKIYGIYRDIEEVLDLENLIPSLLKPWNALDYTVDEYTHRILPDIKRVFGDEIVMEFSAEQIWIISSSFSANKKKDLAKHYKGLSKQVTDKEILSNSANPKSTVKEDNEVSEALGGALGLS